MGFGSFFGNTSNRTLRTATTTTNNVDTNTTGMEDVSGTAIQGSGNTLNISDSGATRDALDFAGTFGLDAFNFGRESLDLGSRALDTAGTATYDALNFGRDALGANMEISAAALDLGARANDNATDLGYSAIRTAEYLGGRGIDAAEFASANTLVATRDALDFGARSLAGVLDAVDMGYAYADNATARASNFAADAMLAGSGLARDAVSDALDYGRSMYSAAIGANQATTAANLSGLTALARETSASADDRVSKVAVYALMAVAAAMVLPAIFRGRAA